MDFVLDAAVTEKFPHYSAKIVVAKNLAMQNDKAALVALRQAEAHVRAHLGFAKASEHPHMQAWREAFKTFGLKPSDFQNSSEALLSRVLKGKELPSIHPLVNIYNAVSLRHVVPVGGENLDAAIGVARLCFATGQEDFDTMQDGTVSIQHPKVGEVIWRDDAGVTCRAWNWRQCLRTRLEGEIKNAYFVLDRLAPMTLAELNAASQELVGLLLQLSPGCEITEFILGTEV